MTLEENDLSEQREQQIETAVSQLNKAQSLETASERLAKLLDFYDEIEDKETESAQTVRVAFLNTLKSFPELLGQIRLAEFLAHRIMADDFVELKWQEPDSVLLFCETLYGIPYQDEEMAERTRGNVRKLLRHVLYQYEDAGEMEKMFQLLRVAPTHPMMQDLELRRLRYRADFYEMNRVKRHRRYLYIYLVAQAFLIVFVFPLLFINAENGAIQRQVENLTDVELGDEGYRTYSYMDGLYWSTITASSIGYGDITPVTNTGRMIAATLGTMGVITIGIIAGLILNWITPRRID